MSELKRGWWKGRMFDINLGYGGFTLSFEQMQHVRDAFELIQHIYDENYLVGRKEDSDCECILNRGTPPEPEWGPLGVAPDREGVWEGRTPDNGFERIRLTLRMGRLCFDLGGWSVVHVDDVDHSRWQYRRIGDL